MLARSLIKTGISTSLAWSGGANILGRVTGKRSLPLVLGYHNVVKEYDYSSLCAIPSSLVSTQTLLKQLEWIARRYEICSLDEVHRRAVSQRGKPVAAVTFDDGYANVYRNAFPLLVRKGIPFAVFVTTDLIGSEDLFLHDELYLRLGVFLSRYKDTTMRLGELLHRAGCWDAISPVFTATDSDPYQLTRAMLGAFSQKQIRTVVEILSAHTELSGSVAGQSRVMDWDMLHEMQRAGVLIGGHSKTHAIFTKEDAGTVLEEARTGRETLENNLRAPVEHFAYPDGAFDEASVQAVARAGYRYAYTVCSHRSSTAPNLTIPRLMLWERSNADVMGRFSGAIMACQVNGLFGTPAACASGHL